MTKQQENTKTCIHSANETFETKQQPFSFSSLFQNLLLLILFAQLSSFIIPCQATCRKVERDSLLAFSSGVSSSYPLNWSSSIDCCMWEGVSCDNNDRVIHLLLPSRGLVGSISPSIANLSHLSQLNLSQNSLSGPIPDGFFMALNRLVIIDISHNRLTGQLSDSDKLMSTVAIVDFSGNHFYGRIQSSFLQRALNLQRFDVRNNSFSGSIPSSVCRFSPSIVHLDFSNNDFLGPISQGFGQCPNLLRLKAGFNNLSGAIPSDIYTISALQELYLPANKLSGVIDGSIVNLINLRILSLYGNELTGMIPQDIGRLSNLVQLWLHINKLNGTLPQSLTNCTRLTTLNLRVNLLEGELSAFDFSKFIQLRSIDLGNNFFRGRLPSSLFLCKNLTAIRLATNSLNGEVLPDIMALQSLSFLSLSNNSLNNITSAMRILTGCKNLSTLILSKNFYNEPLPGDENLIRAGEFQNLQVLGLGGCGFTGLIPIWLSRLDKLEVLDLSLNNITGSVPGWFGDLPNLFYLDLSQNLLSGKFTMELIKLRRLATQRTSDQVDQSYLELPVFVQPNNASNLQYNQLSNLPPAIYLRSNSISGTIPIEIGQLKFIVALDLSDNNFSGSIPDTISNLTNLEKLDLSINYLSGRIPASLTKLHFLSFFNVAYNNLDGPIPVGGQFDTFPNSSFEGNPRLCGKILQRSCSSQSETTHQLARRKGTKREIINWHIFGISFGISFILAVLADFKFLSWKRWMVWWYRNKVVHSGLPQSAEIVGEVSVITARHRFYFEAPTPSSISPEWRVPNIGELKINTGAAAQLGEHYIGIGAVIRDHEGVVVSACSQRMVGGFQPEVAEAIALREGLLFAKNNRFKLAVAECDALRIIQCLHSEFCMTSYAAILYDIVALLEEVNCEPVVSNWLDCIPIFLSHSVLVDMN
ncbi:unnamed protein product [Fraxinus pennsylvanica]|uniref:Uncharacterized protein n=1 Tax=Fraxinus pennsylvanica TaxID=56036 RepID=A0AAD2DNE5_9LAMI|nr:unnamed protein product [Fraxinus pennsylvanica]